MECYFTGNKNVFSLGWVSAKTENTVVLCSRDVNARTQGVRDLELDLTNWKPIVVEKQLVTWMLSEPEADEKARARRLTGSQIAKLEDMWKNN